MSVQSQQFSRPRTSIWARLTTNGLAVPDLALGAQQAPNCHHYHPGLYTSDTSDRHQLVRPRAIRAIPVIRSVPLSTAHQVPPPRHVGNSQGRMVVWQHDSMALWQSSPHLLDSTISMAVVGVCSCLRFVPLCSAPTTRYFNHLYTSLNHEKGQSNPHKDGRHTIIRIATRRFEDQTELEPPATPSSHPSLFLVVQLIQLVPIALRT